MTTASSSDRALRHASRKTAVRHQVSYSDAARTLTRSSTARSPLDPQPHKLIEELGAEAVVEEVATLARCLSGLARDANGAEQLAAAAMVNDAVARHREVTSIGCGRCLLGIDNERPCAVEERVRIRLQEAEAP